MKKVLAIVMTVLLLATSVIGLSACGNKEDANTFTWLLDVGEDTTYYSSYNQNPVALYVLQKEYAGSKINIEYNQLVTGSEKDQYNTMISTGEYYDVMGVSFSSYSPLALNEMGIVLDITEYVEKWMPNYMKVVNSNEEVKRVAYTTNESGEKRMYSLWGASDIPQYNFEGYCYRRDWIVKYGKNPSTGEAFSGEVNADGVMIDNVKFPSWYSDSKYAVEYKANHPDWDGSDPIFISDWEWMFEIFDAARKDLGIADKGYNYAPFYVGYQQTGDLFSGFGGGGPVWSYDAESGKVQFKATSDSMKSYLECLSTWYKNGWIDTAFEQHSSDMFFRIDTAKVYSGYVGLWQGTRATLADQLESDAYPATKGIYVSGAKQPINDLYGAESTKGKEPDSMYQFECPTVQIIITDKAKDKNLEALFTYLDSFYEVGSDNYIAKNYGLTKEQYDSIKPLQETVDGKVYQERFGIDCDSYTLTEKDGHPFYTQIDAIRTNNYLENATKGNRMWGYQELAEFNNITANIYDAVVEKWAYYPNKGYISGSIISLMSTEKNTAYTKTLNKINDKMSVEIPKFIKGTADLNGADWETYVKTINKMGYEKITGYLQEVYDSFK